MGDPVGTSSAFGELLWKFKEQADRFGAKIVFIKLVKNTYRFILILD